MWARMGEVCVCVMGMVVFLIALGVPLDVKKRGAQPGRVTNGHTNARVRTITSLSGEGMCWPRGVASWGILKRAT
jgi:hypothetical protein